MAKRRFWVSRSGFGLRFYVSNTRPSLTLALPILLPPQAAASVYAVRCAKCLVLFSSLLGRRPGDLIQALPSPVSQMGNEKPERLPRGRCPGANTWRPTRWPLSGSSSIRTHPAGKSSVRRPRAELGLPRATHKMVAGQGMKPGPCYSLLHGVTVRTRSCFWQEPVTTAPVSEVGKLRCAQTGKSSHSPGPGLLPWPRPAFSTAPGKRLQGDLPGPDARPARARPTGTRTGKQGPRF